MRISHLAVLATWANACLFGATNSGQAVEFTVETGPEFKTGVNQDDLLEGVPFHSNLELTAGDFYKMTDGLGSKPNESFRTFAHDGVEDWVITFSKLKIVEVEEIRVFSWNGDH